MFLLKIVIISYISFLNYILSAILGNFYKYIIRKLFNFYSYASKFLTLESSHENLLNETLNRLDATDHKLTALQNKMVSLERIVQQLQYKSNVVRMPNSETQTSSLPSIGSQIPINQMKSKLTQTMEENWSQNKKQSGSGLSSQIVWHLLSGQSEKSGRNSTCSLATIGQRNNITRRQCNCDCHHL